MAIVATVVIATLISLMSLTVPSARAAAATPAGKLLVHRYAPQQKQADIFELRSSGRVIRLTRTAAFESSATYSPDGRRIAFVRRSPDKSRFSLMTMRSDGSGITRVAGGAATGIEWSPDGAWISYVASSANGLELHVVSPEGGSDRVVAAAEFIGHRISWAPDSSVLAFSARMEQGINDDIYSVAPDGTGLTRLTDSPGSDNSPSFSPDASRIVFSTTRDDANGSGEDAPGPYSSELYLMNADGSAETALTQTPDTWDELPEWAPQGNLIAYQRRYDNDVQSGPGWDIDVLVVDAGTGETRTITVNRRADDYAPLWSPDARWVAFDRRRPGNDSEVFVASVDAHDVRQLTSNETADDSPLDWFAR